MYTTISKQSPGTFKHTVLLKVHYEKIFKIIMAFIVNVQLTEACITKSSIVKSTSFAVTDNKSAVIPLFMLLRLSLSLGGLKYLCTTNKIHSHILEATLLVKFTQGKN